jgi:hypothetical protein
MRIYVFVSGTDPDLLCFTSDASGGNLPDDLGPWQQEVAPGMIVVGTDDDPIAEIVCRNGFCVLTDRIDCRRRRATGRVVTTPAACLSR